MVDILMNLLTPVIENFSLKFDDALFEEILPHPQSIPYIQKNQACNFYLKLRRPATDEDRVEFKFKNTFTNSEENIVLPLVASVKSRDVASLFGFKKITLLENVMNNTRTKDSILRDWTADLKTDIVK